MEKERRKTPFWVACAIWAFLPLTSILITLQLLFGSDIQGSFLNQAIQALGDALALAFQWLSSPVSAIAMGFGIYSLKRSLSVIGLIPSSRRTDTLCGAVSGVSFLMMMMVINKIINESWKHIWAGPAIGPNVVFLCCSAILALIGGIWHKRLRKDSSEGRNELHVIGPLFTIILVMGLVVSLAMVGGSDHRNDDLRNALLTVDEKDENWEAANVVLTRAILAEGDRYRASTTTFRLMMVEDLDKISTYQDHKGDLWFRAGEQDMKCDFVSDDVVKVSQPHSIFMISPLSRALAVRTCIMKFRGSP